MRRISRGKIQPDPPIKTSPGKRGGSFEWWVRWGRKRTKSSHKLGFKNQEKIRNKEGDWPEKKKEPGNHYYGGVCCDVGVLEKEPKRKVRQD